MKEFVHATQGKHFQSMLCLHDILNAAVSGCIRHVCAYTSD